MMDFLGMEQPGCCLVYESKAWGVLIAMYDGIHWVPINRLAIEIVYRTKLTVFHYLDCGWSTELLPQVRSLRNFTVASVAVARVHLRIV